MHVYYLCQKLQGCFLLWWIITTNSPDSSSLVLYSKLMYPVVYNHKLWIMVSPLHHLPWVEGSGGETLLLHTFLQSHLRHCLLNRSNSKIQGFRIVEEMMKLSLFANDLNCFLRDKDSYMLFQFNLSTLVITPVEG